MSKQTVILDLDLVRICWAFLTMQARVTFDHTSWTLLIAEGWGLVAQSSFGFGIWTLGLALLFWMLR